MNLGFVGLGHLGRAIAGRLLESGHTLSVWNRTPARTAGLQANIAAAPRETVATADIVFLCLFDSSAVRTVLTGENGLLSAPIAGKILVDLSTNHFRDVLEFHALCRKAGAAYLETPVLGSVAPAAQGALTVLISGDRVAYEKIKPVLEQIGKTLFYLGEPGLATKMKLINNLALGSFMATLAEAVSLAEDVGIEKAKVLDILAAGGGNSLVLNAKRKSLLSEDFTAQFSSALIYKDLHCLQDLAYERKKPLFTGSVVKELFARAIELGMDKEDFSAVYKVFRRS